jgi:hypothetical protein
MTDEEEEEPTILELLEVVYLSLNPSLSANNSFCHKTLKKIIQRLRDDNN